MTPLLEDVILFQMVGEETKSHPILVVFNYWEMRPSALGPRLDELLRGGVTQIASFVPWQAVESDISHAMPKFLQAASERKMALKLIVTPEVGVHYPLSGLPRDFLKSEDTEARAPDGSRVISLLPPQAFALPSLYSSELIKRYYSFLSRFDSLLGDIERQHSKVLRNVSVILTGSYWKYYRSPGGFGSHAFDGQAGDRSSPGQLAFRSRIEQQFASREFQESGPTLAMRWKSRAMEPVNRLWFHNQSEAVFRARSRQMMGKKTKVPVRQIELFTPEADPAIAYSSFLQLAAIQPSAVGRADFKKLSHLMVDYSKRSSQAEGQFNGPYIHWTKLHGFRSLSDAERQFLFLQALLTSGGAGGGVLIDESEWFSFSRSFRARAESLGRLIEQGDLALGTSAYYLAPHLWSGCSPIWDELEMQLNGQSKVISSVEALELARESGRPIQLLVVDPAVIFTAELISKCIALARQGVLLALPRSTFYTDAAKRELEAAFLTGTGIEMNLGVSYLVQPLGLGKIVLYNANDHRTDTSAEMQATTWKPFMSSVLAMANLSAYCTTSDSRIRVITLSRSDGGHALFIMNGSPRPVTADLFFRGEVSVSDLMSHFGNSGSDREEGSAPTHRFGLEVPAFGVLPVAVDGLGEAATERRLAQETSELMAGNVRDAAAAELAGFSDRGPSIEDLWN